MRQISIGSAALVLIVLSLGPVAGDARAQGKPREPVAVVGEQPIYDDDLLPFVQAQVFQLRLQEYEIKSRALENLVNQRLLEREAKRKRIPVEIILEHEVDAKVPEPTDAGLQALYIVQKELLKNRPQAQREHAYGENACLQPVPQTSRRQPGTGGPLGIGAYGGHRAWGDEEAAAARGARVVRKD